LDSKTDLQKDGVLIFDEISLRESVAVNSMYLDVIHVFKYTQSENVVLQ